MIALITAVIIEMNGVYKTDYDPLLFVELARRESNFKADARGAAGELGMFQIMPYNWNNCGYYYEHWSDAETNTKAAFKIWHGLRYQYQNDWLTLLVWNAGSKFLRDGKAPPASSIQFANDIITKYNAVKEARIAKIKGADKC